MPRPSGSRPARFSSGAIGAGASLAGLILIAIASLEAVVDQISDLPPRPSTPAEAAAALPGARAAFSALLPALSRRADADGPLELGEVWATRGGRICGLLDARSSAVDDMEPFFTESGALYLRSDNIRLYIREWRACLKDRWVEILRGSEETGMCGSRRFPRTRLGRRLCPRVEAIRALYPGYGG